MLQVLPNDWVESTRMYRLKYIEQFITDVCKWLDIYKVNMTFVEHCTILDMILNVFMLCKNAPVAWLWLITQQCKEIIIALEWALAETMLVIYVCLLSEWMLHFSATSLTGYHRYKSVSIYLRTPVILKKSYVLIVRQACHVLFLPLLLLLMQYFCLFLSRDITCIGPTHDENDVMSTWNAAGWVKVKKR